MMQLNRKKFWGEYHKYFEIGAPTTQATVDALNAILDKFESETRLKNVAQFAYVLATAFHESGIGGNHFVPVKEGKARKGSEAWEKYQKFYWFTGFFGRGLVQTTHEENYLKIGKLLGVGDMFVKNPDLLLEIDWAYEALVAGMIFGIYRKDAKGKQTLDRYLKSADESTAKYYEAREIVNGDKKKNGLKIAVYAQDFEQILKISAAVPTANINTAKTNRDVSDTDEGTRQNSVGFPSNPPETVPPLNNFNTGNGVTELTANIVPETDARGQTAETTVEQFENADGSLVTKQTTDVTDKFTPQNIPAFIPRFGKQWFLSIIPGAGLFSTVCAYLANAPVWLVFGLGLLTGIAATLFLQAFINHRQQVTTFLIECYRTLANPAMDNLIPTNAAYFGSSRRRTIEKSLETNQVVTRLSANFQRLPQNLRDEIEQKYFGETL